MARHRSHSIDFKHQVVAGVPRRGDASRAWHAHDLSRNLIRIWVEKGERAVRS